VFLAEPARGGEGVAVSKAEFGSYDELGVDQSVRIKTLRNENKK